jgi:DNA modification methylase
VAAAALRNVILCGDVREKLREIPAETVHCVVTSPPYWGLRDYGVDGQLGLEATPEEYVDNMVAVFREVRRVLRKDGTLWLNLGDSYVGGREKLGSEGAKQRTSAGATWSGNDALATLKAKVAGLKPKDMVGIPWRVAFALQADGWYLRSDIIWSKPNPMPESVTDRPTKAHEYLFLLSKSQRYYYDAEAIKEAGAGYGRSTGGFRGEGAYTQGRSYDNSNGERVKGNTQGHSYEGGRNKRTVWEIATEPYSEAHFATFPTELVKPCILAGCPEDGLVMDPFMGSGTTALVALRAKRDYIGVELNPAYVAMAEARLADLKAQGRLL